MERGGDDAEAADLDDAAATAPPAAASPGGPRRARRLAPLLLAAALGAGLGAGAEAAHLRGADDAAGRAGTATGTGTSRVSPVGAVAPDALGGVRTGTWSYLTDRLQVALANADPPGSPPARIGLIASPGLRATTDPPVPFDLAAGRSTFVDVRVDPDCAVVGDGSMSYLQLVVLDADGRPTEQVTHDRWAPQSSVREGTSVWLAQRTATACG